MIPFFCVCLCKFLLPLSSTWLAISMLRSIWFRWRPLRELKLISIWYPLRALRVRRIHIDDGRQHTAASCLRYFYCSLDPHRTRLFRCTKSTCQSPGAWRFIGSAKNVLKTWTRSTKALATIASARRALKSTPRTSRMQLWSSKVSRTRSGIFN
jgi:hypothetical protein